ncbi:MAG: competence/damage-inducible protein A [Firmicutes bacterium]|nr:competence/damage-inducible protein A [Bacillota bacterium]MDH7496510.1 competence/damage-inducible protein A [Bacillota bacterium]
MRAEVISIGTELLLGQIVDTNAAYICLRLAEVGVDVFHRVTVGDNLDRVAAAIADALARADVVITTGGLGPTEDDPTREAVARATGLPLVVSDQALRHAESLLARSGHPMDRARESALTQARVPRGALVIHNDRGTACGFIVESDAKAVISMPGVPGEMQGMMESTVVPYLRDRAGGAGTVIRWRELRICGRGETAVEDEVRDLLHGRANPTVAPLVSLGEVRLRITAKARSAEEAEAMIAPVEAEIRARLGEDVYGADDDELHAVVVRLLAERKLACAVAESVTGGLIAHKLTEVPGCSAVMGLAVTSYSDDAKRRVLGVPAELLDRHGAVSREVAVAMARGVLGLGRADVAVSTTGLAGPSGGRQKQPVGLVYVGLAWRNGVACTRLMLFGTRTEIRERAAKKALDLLRRRLLRR